RTVATRPHRRHPPCAGTADHAPCGHTTPLAPPTSSGDGSPHALWSTLPTGAGGTGRRWNTVGGAGFPSSTTDGRSGGGLAGGLVALAAQRGDGVFEVGQGTEALVDAGESQVGDLIELAKRAEDRQAHLVGVDLRSAGAADGLFDLLGEKRELVFTHRAALTGLPSAGDHLVATEGFHGS